MICCPSAVNILKGRTTSYLVRNVWYLVISYDVPLECNVWLLILSLWALHNNKKYWMLLILALACFVPDGSCNLPSALDWRQQRVYCPARLLLGPDRKMGQIGYMWTLVWLQYTIFHCILNKCLSLKHSPKYWLMSCVWGRVSPPVFRSGCH